MDVDEALRPGTVMQVIDILGDDQELARPFGVEPRQRAVRRVRFDRPKLLPPLIVEAMDQLRIAAQRLRGADILDAMALPQSVRAAEGREAAFGGDAGACQNDDVADLGHRDHEAAKAGTGKRMTAISLFGSSGRMGKAIAEVVAGEANARIVTDTPDVFIDFSAPDALAKNLAVARDAQRPIVIGTTGFKPENHALIDAAAAEIPVLYAANMSLGVNMLAFLVREAAARLGPDWDIEIAEMHHRHKVDAPSGTALLLGEAAAAGRGIDLAGHSERGRDGIGKARAQGAIGFASLRGGSVAGDHLVVIAGDGERIELGHRAESRAIFARGAVQAALWLHDKPPGRYSMNDVLGL